MSTCKRAFVCLLVCAFVHLCKRAFVGLCIRVLIYMLPPGAYVLLMKLDNIFYKLNKNTFLNYGRKT